MKHPLDPQWATEFDCPNPPVVHDGVDYSDAIRREAEAHAEFFGNPGDAERIEAREEVSIANVAVGYVDYLKPYLGPGNDDRR